MSFWTAMVLIVLITAIAGVMRSRHGGSDRIGKQGERDDTARLPSAREQELQREVEDLRNRIHVLERIATDGNTPNARETQRIAAEIEALRDKQGS